MVYVETVRDAHSAIVDTQCILYWLLILQLPTD